ncbi:hypothetical protein [Psychroflexus montanilacus]|uniref:hypothetical protein n=1 Tax=Psychroflexus montanilacus TaxID=2873598 RepID=UPI001CCFCF8E|nr:hypothetical protein [Psychroflexus montanilacus]MBZ9652658.1 hypothetical protein [Psychroflexus montanilacus]
MNITRKAKQEILALENGRNFDNYIRQLYVEERTSIDVSLMWCVNRKQIKLVEHNSVEGFNLLKYGYKIVAILSSCDEEIDSQYVDGNYFEAFKKYVEVTRF